MTESDKRAFELIAEMKKTREAIADDKKMRDLVAEVQERTRNAEQLVRSVKEQFRPASEGLEKLAHLDRRMVEDARERLEKFLRPQLSELRTPKLDMLKLHTAPLPPIVKQESAADMVEALIAAVNQWRSRNAASGAQLAVLAILQNGAEITVEKVSAVGVQLLRIEGTLNGGPVALLSHMSLVQFACLPLAPSAPPRPIGFDTGR